jgi:hypothetical protein
MESLFQQKKSPRTIAWTAASRRYHKKGTTEEFARKKTRKTVKFTRGVEVSRYLQRHDCRVSFLHELLFFDACTILGASSSMRHI